MIVLISLVCFLVVVCVFLYMELRNTDKKCIALNEELDKLKNIQYYATDNMLQIKIGEKYLTFQYNSIRNEWFLVSVIGASCSRLYPKEVVTINYDYNSSLTYKPLVPLERDTSKDCVITINKLRLDLYDKIPLLPNTKLVALYKALHSCSHDYKIINDNDDVSHNRMKSVCNKCECEHVNSFKEAKGFI